MVLGGLMSQLPSAAAALLVFSSILSSANCHALPRQTKTVEYRELDVLPWPLATAGPELGDLLRRQNTVCGYIGGDASLPATCSAGSHCAVDVEHGAVGCCPDSGACTQGIFTGCVDSNSDPQTEINPYVYTCSGSNICYKNSFDGGYVQYGCGSASNLATSVMNSASGKSAVQFTSVSGVLTATATSLSEPTTLGTKRSTSTRPSSTTDTESTSTASKTSSKTSSASSDSSTTDATSTASATTDSATASSTSDAEDDDTDAPAKDNKNKNTGAIVGGTISGVAALIALIALGIWLWKRKKGNARQGPGPKPESMQYVSPVSRNSHNFAPLPSNQDMYENSTIRAVPEAHTTELSGGDPSRFEFGTAPEQYEPHYPYGYGPGSTAGGIAALGGTGGAAASGGQHLEADEIPLTRKSDDYHQPYGHPLDRIEEDDARPETSPQSMGPYRPRGDGGGSLWQQNRGSSRNLTWI